MNEIQVTLQPNGAAVSLDESLTPREVRYEQGTVTILFDTRESTVVVDRIMEPGKGFLVNDSHDPDPEPVGRFETLAEAQACVVGLEYFAKPKDAPGRWIIGPARE